MKFLPLTQGQVAIIDDDDFEKVGQFKWYAVKTTSGNFYVARTARIGNKRVMLLLHCEILGVKGLDHIDGNGLNCQRENLRPATRQQNSRAYQRKKLGVSSIYRGVYWDSTNLNWRAQVRVKKVSFDLGRFTDEKDAARAYDQRAKKLGFFTEALNFPFNL